MFTLLDVFNVDQNNVDALQRQRFKFGWEFMVIRASVAGEGVPSGDGRVEGVGGVGVRVGGGEGGGQGTSGRESGERLEDPQLLVTTRPGLHSSTLCGFGRQTCMDTHKHIDTHKHTRHTHRHKGAINVRDS